MTPKSIITLSVFVFAFTATFAQIENAISDEIKKLKAKGIDTFVSVSTPRYYSPPVTLKGIGTVFVYSEFYLFYKNNGILQSIKIVSRCNEDCSETITSVSKPQPISIDSIFPFLKSHYKDLESEHIRPYIYRNFDPGVNSEVFETSRSSHPPVYYFMIQAAEENFYQTVNTDDLLLKKWYLPDNMNYNYNSKTRLGVFVGILIRLVEMKDSQFYF